MHASSLGDALPAICPVGLGHACRHLSVHSHSPSLTSEANVTDLKVPIVFTAALLPCCCFHYSCLFT